MTVSVAAVDAILRAEDMEGLLAVGAPEDEYSDEAREIQFALEQLGDDQLTSERVSTAVMHVWENSFGPFSAEDVQKRQPVLQELVNRILDERVTRAVGSSSDAGSGFVAGPGGKYRS